MAKNLMQKKCIKFIVKLVYLGTYKIFQRFRFSTFNSSLLVLIQFDFFNSSLTSSRSPTRLRNFWPTEISDSKQVVEIRNRKLKLG